MSISVEKLARLAETDRSDLDLLRKKVQDGARDKNGSASCALAGALRLVAVADYLSSHDVAAFRLGLSEAAELYCRLFARFDAGEAISPSYVSMMSYKELLNALAAGNDELARSFAERMGGRQAVETEYDRPFDIALGYSLKSLLASDNAGAKRWIDEFAASCQEAESRDFQGYAKVLRAILDKDGESVSSGLADVIVGHKRQSKGSGLFKDTEDELLCVWGIGLANLAHMCGVPVHVDDPLIPADLLN